MAIVHKSERGGGTACGAGNPTAGTGIPDAAIAASIYWDGTTCPDCLKFRPEDAGGRMSIKRSHRAEGDNTLD